MDFPTDLEAAGTSVGRKTRSGREYGCFILQSHASFDIAALDGCSLVLEEDVTVESADFMVIAGDPDPVSDDEAGDRAERADGPLPAQSPMLRDHVDSGESNPKRLAALKSNRVKKRKRREKDTSSEEVARRRVHFLAQATIVKSEVYEVQSGRHSRSGAEYPICDSKGRIFAVVLGWPSGWEKRTAAANLAMERLQQALASSQPPANRRGDFAAYAVGFSYRGGQQVALPFRRTKREATAIREFLDDPDVEAVLKYIGRAMATWFPIHVQEYNSCLETLAAHDETLTPPSPHLPFPALTVNAGRRTICLPHRDSPNDAAGVCLDWLLGSYDVRYGGQLVLHEPRKILALEPGRVALFPSAIITHETIPI